MTGAVDANYSIKPSRLSPPSPGFAMERVQIAAGQFITIGTSFIRGYRDKPVQIKEENFPERLRNIGERLFVLHDAGVRKAWLVDGLSTVLHLLRCYLAEASKPNDYSSTFLNPFLKPIGDGSGRGAAYKTLVHDANLELRIHGTKRAPNSSEPTSAAVDTKKDEYSGVLSIQDRTETILHILEQICGHHEDRREDRSIGSRIKASPETHLEGFDFTDIANNTTNIFPKAAELALGGNAWVGLTRAIHAPVLFGRHFGELLLPTALHEESCMKHHWDGPSPVGQDTLAVSLTELRRIAGIDDDEQLRIDAPLHLVDGYCLKLSARLFSKCSWIGGHHGCKERLTRISRRRSQGTQGRLTRPERASSQFWGKLKRKISHPTPTQSAAAAFVPKEGAVLLGQKRLRRQKRNTYLPKQPRKIKQEDSERSQASSSRLTTTESTRTRGSEKLSENTSMTELTQSSSEKSSTQSSYQSAKSQLSDL